MLATFAPTVGLFVLMGLALAGAGGAFWLGLTLRHQVRRSDALLLHHLDQLELDLAHLADEKSSLASRLDAVERRYRDLAARHERSTRLEPATKTYRNAVALLERGANTEVLVDTCGMARGEAELVAYLHDADRQMNH